MLAALAAHTCSLQVYMSLQEYTSYFLLSDSKRDATPEKN